MKKFSTRLSTVAILATLLALAALPALSQYAGRRGFGIPEPTERGEWTGTWFHVERDRKTALWIRQDADGTPHLRIQYFSNLGDEQFRTDWDGTAAYDARGTTGYFNLTLDKADENAMEGSWDWKLEFVDSGRVETSIVKIYRTGDGRSLAFLFPDWVQTLRRGSFVQDTEAPHVWTFRKISRRELIWDELPL